MAGTPERAQELMMRVWPAAVARVREEVAEQQAMARRLGHAITIEPWDYRYYMEKVRQDRFNLSQEELKPYFELSNMIEGMFHMAGQLYGLRFTENTGTVPVWHPDIRTWRVTDARGPRRRHLLRRHVRAHRQALGRLGDHLSQPRRACSATASCWARTTTISPSRARTSRC